MCSNLSVPTNGEVSYDMNNRAAGTVANYTCTSSYTLMGNTTRTCGSGGLWSGSAPACHVFPVFVTLGTTNYTAMNSQIAIDTIGETAESALTCRTDLSTCCRGGDNPDSNDGFGEWQFPNGTNIIRNQEVTVSDTDLFYRSRGRSSLFLNRRGSVSGPTGSYCCVLPASIGEVTFCVELGESLPPLSFALSCYLFLQWLVLSQVILTDPFSL